MSDPLKNAAQGVIEVWFTPSASDLKTLVRLDPDRPVHIIITVLSRMGAFALAAGLTGAILWILDRFFSQNDLRSLTFTIVGGLAGTAAFRLLAEQTWRQRIRKALFDPARRLHITGDGQALTIEDEHISYRIAFSGIDRLIHSPTHLVLFRNRTSLLALPKVAFDRPEVFDSFASFPRSLLAAPDPSKPVPEKTHD